MTLAALLAYSGALFIAATIPGPGVTALVARALGSGFRETFFMGLGLIVGDMVYLTAVVLVVMLAFVFWCISAIVLGVLTLRRRNWARIMLVVSSAVTALFSLLGITSGISALTLIAAIAVIVLLFTGGANQWFAKRQPDQLPTGTSQPWG
eukprot:gene19094-23392_t